MTIAERLAEVRERIAGAAARAGRDPNEVILVAVSKTFGTDAIIEGLEAGIHDFGENRAQELRQKVAIVGDRVRWHFVGHLQTNKVRHVVGSAALVHSVDRFGLAEAIARRTRAAGTVQDVLIQVNVAGEGGKEGAGPEQAAALAEKVAALDGIEVRGLMTMPPYPRDPEDSRPHYARLRELLDIVARDVPGTTELSMGMSRDLEIAVEEGATLVRIGEAIFGSRTG
ncbi:MAG: YggS family pyridoxal phosphate-dependent enzyme [Actinomycetota bacterium]